METKANYAIVGFFTVAVMLLAFGFVYWMSEYGRKGEMEMLSIRIPGSVNGLTVGSPVRFNGIQIGTVRGLRVDFDDPRFSLAVTEVRADSPVRPGTTAVLEIQGLTGAAFIEMSGGDTSQKRLWEIEAMKPQPGIPMVLAHQSGVTNILATASEILTKTDRTMVDLQGFVKDNRAPLTKTISNAEAFSQALKNNAKGVDEFLESVSSLSGTIKNLSGRLDSTLASAENLLKSIDSKKVDNILANAEKVSGDLAAASGNVGKTIKSIDEAVATYKDLGQRANTSLEKIDKLMAAIDPQKVQGSIDDIRAAVSDARAAVNNFKGISQDIDKRRADIDKTISDFSEMSAKLNKASSRVDGVLAKVDSFLGSGDSSSLFADARETLQSIRKVADNLNSQIGPIASNLQRFSGSGLRNVEALVTDTRRTVNNLNNAISRIDNNPQRLLFGGEEVKQFDGRTRR